MNFMPSRSIAAKALADLLSVISHPHRLRIIEELAGEEMDVTRLTEVLGISHSGASQHLSILRASRLVRDRRDGRRVVYSLRQPELATWLLEGLRFLETEDTDTGEMRSAIQVARKAWLRK